MNKQTNRNIVIGSILTLALAVAIWTPLQSQSAKPADGKMMMDGKMTEQCQKMMEQKQKMAAEVKAADAQLTEQVAKMNSAPANKKMDLMAAVVTHMLEHQVSMNEQRATMDEEMMGHMMQHMQMGSESMSQCPMMMGMKDMSGSSMGAKKDQLKDK